MVVAAGQGGISIGNSLHATVRNNKLISVATGMQISDCADSDFYNNILLTSQRGGTQSRAITEQDTITYTVSTTAGSPVVTVSTGSVIPWYVRGRTITINSVDYTIRARVAQDTLLLTSNAASDLTDVTGTMKWASNRYYNNYASTITLQSGGSSVVYSTADSVKATTDGTQTLSNKTLTGPVIGSGGTALTKVLKGTVAIDPASINANTVSEQSFALTGAATGDSLTLNPPAAGLTAGLLVLQAYVSAADTIKITFQNTTGSPIDEAGANWTYKLVR